MASSARVVKGPRLALASPGFWAVHRCRGGRGGALVVFLAGVDGADQRALRVAEDRQLLAVDGLDGAGAPASADSVGDGIAEFEVVHGCGLLSEGDASGWVSGR